jgi:hypothetical protein
VYPGDGQGVYLRHLVFIERPTVRDSGVWFGAAFVVGQAVAVGVTEMSDSEHEVLLAAASANASVEDTARAMKMLGVFTKAYVDEFPRGVRRHVRAAAADAEVMHGRIFVVPVSWWPRNLHRSLVLRTHFAN